MGQSTDIKTKTTNNLFNLKSWGLLITTVVAVVGGMLFVYFRPSVDFFRALILLTFLIVIPSGVLLTIVVAGLKFHETNELNRNVISISLLAYTGLVIAIFLTRGTFTNEWAILIVGLFPILALLFLVLPNFFSRIKTKFGDFELEFETLKKHTEETLSLGANEKLITNNTHTLEEYIKSLLLKHGRHLKTLVIEVSSSATSSFSLSELLEALRKVFPNLKTIVFVDKNRKYKGHLSVQKYLAKYPPMKATITFGLNENQFDRFLNMFLQNRYNSERENTGLFADIVGNLSRYNDSREELNNELKYWIKKVFDAQEALELDKNSHFVNPNTSGAELLEDMYSRNVDNFATINESGEYLGMLYREEVAEQIAMAQLIKREK